MGICLVIYKTFIVKCTQALCVISRVPPQRRLALTSGNVPDFDGSVVAAASDKFAVRRKSDGADPVIETSQHMQYTGREKDHQKKTYSFKWPVTVDSHLQKEIRKNYKKTYEVVCPLSVDWHSTF